MLDYRLFKEINALFAAGNFHAARRLLMEVQSRVIALRDEMSTLKIRIHTLEEAVHLSTALYPKNGAYWLATEGVHQGPFCTDCYENSGGLIRFERFSGGLVCPCCSSSLPLPESAGFYAEGRSPQHARIIPFARQRSSGI